MLPAVLQKIPGDDQVHLSIQAVVCAVVVFQLQVVVVRDPKKCQLRAPRPLDMEITLSRSYGPRCNGEGDHAAVLYCSTSRDNSMSFVRPDSFKLHPNWSTSQQVNPSELPIITALTSKSCHLMLCL